MSEGRPKRTRTARLGHDLLLGLAAIGLVAVLIVATPLVEWLIPEKAGSFDPPPGDTLVVLAAGSIGDAPNLESSWRCIYAARFYRMGLYRRVIISGGQPHPGVPATSALMASLMESLGVPRDRIELEQQSRTTRENALDVARLPDRASFGRIVLLTSEYHSRRAADAFERAGVPVTPLPIPYASKVVSQRAMRLMVLQLALREHAARLVYRLRGWS